MSLINIMYKLTGLVINCVSLQSVIKTNTAVFSNEINRLESHINKEVLSTQGKLVLDDIGEIIITYINIFEKDNHLLRIISTPIFEFIKKYMNLLGQHNLDLDKLINFQYNFHIYIYILLPIILLLLLLFIPLICTVNTCKKVFSQRLNRLDRSRYKLLADQLLTYTSIKKKIRFLLVIVDYILQHQTQTQRTYEYWNDIIKNIFSLPVRRNSINKFLLKLSKEIPRECIEHIKNRIRYNEILSPFVQINGSGTGDVFERRHETENFKNSYLQLLKIIK